jgi:hypothetical protein
VRSNGDGSRALSEIHFSGRRSALAIGNDSTSMDGSGSSK